MSQEPGEKKIIEDANGLLASVVKQFGPDFEPFIEDETKQPLIDALAVERGNNPPDNIHPWECRIGLSRFLVPPINLSMQKTSQVGSLGGSLRSAGSPKFNAGHSQTTLSLTLYFPNHESIWGFDEGRKTIDFDTSDDAVIDKFASSFRGLVTQFKYAPFLPIKNPVINGSMGISSVALQSMTVSTVDGFPFALAVQLNLIKFNHEVFLPMVPDLDSAIHWGRFRQYLGRGAAKLEEIASKNFLTGSGGSESAFSEMTKEEALAELRKNAADSFRTNAVSFDKIKDFSNGKNFDLFYPAHTPLRVVYPDLSGFRSEEEVKKPEKNWWQDMLTDFGFDYSTKMEYGYENTAKYFSGVEGQKYLRNESRILKQYLDISGKLYKDMNDGLLGSYQQYREDYFRLENPEASQDMIDEMRYKATAGWMTYLYNEWINDPLLEKVFAYQRTLNQNLLIKEWEVPMEQLGIDDATCFVQSVSVSMANNFARMQLQMEEEPAFQHLGSLDTTAQISMIITSNNDSNDAITKFTRAIEHVNGLARLEHGHGMLGFFGIKNVLTTLCGMKYALLQQMTTESIENQPYAYRVTLTFTDFDVFQQKREMLSTEQQQDLIESFGKRNPFLRIKQRPNCFNAYPDLPLAVRDTSGKIVGHLDPDYYFDAFDTIDDQYVDFFGYDPKAHYTMITEGDPEAESEEGGAVLPAGVSLTNRGMEFYNGKDPAHDGTMVFWEANHDQMGSNQTSQMKNDDSESGSFAPLAMYQKPYVDGGINPSVQFQTMLMDTKYRDRSGRMVRAFPTYMLWLIDEGGKFAGVKLFDNFYGLQSVMDIALSRSEDSMDDTLILQVSNLYSRLSTPYKDLLDETIYDSAKIINTSLNQARNLVSGTTDALVALDTVDVKPGVRVHLRLGYSSDVSKLETVFNGVITEVTEGEIMTLTCQSDAAEFSAIINGSDEKGHTGKIDGSLFGSLNFSEPRDLMIRLMSMGSGVLQETAFKMSAGEILSENRFGIRHFGMILTEPMSNSEKVKTDIFREAVGSLNAKASSGSDSVVAASNTTSTSVIDLFGSVMGNLSAKRDFELFKRNIYPGNGTGVAQFVGGDLGDGGIAMAWNAGGATEEDPTFTIDNSGAKEQTRVLGDLIVTRTDEGVSVEGGSNNDAGQSHGVGHIFQKMLGWKNEINDDDLGRADEVSFRASTFMKSVWDIFQTCAALLPNYIVAVRPFEDRSTVFYGKPHWNWTSSVIPVSKGIPKVDIADPGHDSQEIMEKLKAAIEADKESDDAFYERISASSPRNANVDPNSAIPGVAWAGGDISKLPLESPGIGRGTAYIPVRMGAVSEEMHLPTDANLDIDKLNHKQLPSLGPFKRHPFYMDRVGGPRGGDRGVKLSKETGDDKTILIGDDPARGGHGGAWGILDPESEQYYIAMRWSYSSDHGAVKMPDCSGSSYRKGGKGKRILVYNTRTKLACVCTPGDFGPAERINRVAGVSPDTSEVLSLKTDDVCMFGFVEDDHPLGPVSFDGDKGSGSTEKLDPTKESLASFEASNKDKGNKTGTIAPLEAWDPAKESLSSYQARTGGNQSTASGAKLPKWVKSGTSASEYSFKFGATDSKVPVFYDENKVGEADPYGSRTKEMYEKYKKRTEDEANGIWDELRDKFPRSVDGQNAIASATYPLDPETNEPLRPSEDLKKETESDEYKEWHTKVMRDFLTWLWQDAWNRGWVIANASKARTMGKAVTSDFSDFFGWVDSRVNPKETGDGWFDRAVGVITAPAELLLDVVSKSAGKVFEIIGAGIDEAHEGMIGEELRDWDFSSSIVPILLIFLGDDAFKTLTSNNYKYNKDQAIEYMKENNGKNVQDHVGILGTSVENFKEATVDKLADLWNVFWDSVGSLATGVLNLLRYNLAMLNGGAQLSTFAEKQANALNALYNDSIYYDAGPPGSLQYYVDNPFTREYHEPVVEVREPFQKIHLLSSFHNIIDNKISEFSGVPTVVTATSGGGHPTTVYFDKGAPSEKQVETTVETGLAWVTPPGFKDMINPLKIFGNLARQRDSAALDFNNGDQTTSAKRVGAWFLKESLKDIYGGELIIIGDPSIRPHDLIYISDSFSRMYGFAHVEQVVHHFSPDMGFVTSITPNAIVTIHDPAKWSTLRIMQQRLASKVIKDAMKSRMNKAERGGGTIPDELNFKDLMKTFETDAMGSISYTGGNTALVKDFAASGQTGQLIRIASGQEDSNPLTSFSDPRVAPPIGSLTKAIGKGAHIGSIIPGFGGPAGAFIGGVLAWKAWGWVKDNLMDQQGAYIDYLTKDGKPMDGGLGFARGVAVGQQRMSTLFADTLRIGVPRQDANGNAMIARDDVLAEMGWSQKEISHMVGEIDMYTNATKAGIYDIAGRPTPDLPPSGKWKVFWVKLQTRPGISGTSAISDGDTLDVSGVGDDVGTIRLGGIDADELSEKSHHYNPELAESEDPDSSGTKSFLWLHNRLKYLTDSDINDYGGEFALRCTLDDNGNPETDVFGSRIIGWIFANPGATGMSAEDRKARLMDWAESAYCTWDGYQQGGAPYTLNWESVVTGHSNVYLYGLNKDLVDEGAAGGVIPFEDPNGD